MSIVPDIYVGESGHLAGNQVPRPRRRLFPWDRWPILSEPAPRAQCSTAVPRHGYWLADGGGQRRDYCRASLPFVSLQSGHSWSALTHRIAATDTATRTRSWAARGSSLLCSAGRQTKHPLQVQCLVSHHSFPHTFTHKHTYGARKTWHRESRICSQIALRCGFAIPCILPHKQPTDRTQERQDMVVRLPGAGQDGGCSDCNGDSKGENGTGPSLFPLPATPIAGLPEVMPQEQLNRQLKDLPQKKREGKLARDGNEHHQEQEEQEQGQGQQEQGQEQDQEQEQEAAGYGDDMPAATKRQEIDEYMRGWRENGLTSHALRALLTTQAEPLPLPRSLLRQQYQPQPEQRLEEDIADTSFLLDDAGGEELAVQGQATNDDALQRSTEEQWQQKRQQHARRLRRRGRRGGAWPRSPVRRILDDYRNYGCSDSNCGSSGHDHRVGTPGSAAEQGVLVPGDPNPPFFEGLFRHKRRELCRGICGVPYDLITRCLAEEAGSIRELCE